MLQAFSAVGIDARVSMKQCWSKVPLAWALFTALAAAGGEP
jgi:hypothetical protein